MLQTLHETTNGNYFLSTNQQLIDIGTVHRFLATFGNLVDVFVQPELRGRGLSTMLVAFVMSHPLIPTLRRLTLATSDAHSLYDKFGFRPLGKPETFMEVYRPAIYRAS